MHAAFEVHRLNQTGMMRATSIAEAFDNLVNQLIANGCDKSPREFAIVMTKLEEATFFAKKAMAKQEVNTKIEG